MYKLPASIDTAQKLKFFIKDFFNKCDQIRSFLQNGSHLLKKSLMETSFYVQFEFIKETLYNGIKSTFEKGKGQFSNQSDHLSAQLKTLDSHLNKHGKHLKALIKLNNVLISKIKHRCGKTLTNNLLK